MQKFTDSNSDITYNHIVCFCIDRVNNIKGKSYFEFTNCRSIGILELFKH